MRFAPFFLLLTQVTSNISDKQSDPKSKATRAFFTNAREPECNSEGYKFDRECMVEKYKNGYVDKEYVFFTAKKSPKVCFDKNLKIHDNIERYKCENLDYDFIINVPSTDLPWYFAIFTPSFWREINLEGHLSTELEFANTLTLVNEIVLRDENLDTKLDDIYNGLYLSQKDRLKDIFKKKGISYEFPPEVESVMITNVCAYD